MEFDDMSDILDKYTVIYDRVIEKLGNIEITDQTIKTKTYFANFWRSVTLREDTQWKNADSKAAYEYFMKTMKEQYSRYGKIDFNQLRMGATLLGVNKRATYIRKVMNELLYDEVSMEIVRQYTTEICGQKESWLKQKRKSFIEKITTSTFHFDDVKRYYDTYTDNYKNRGNGKEIVDTVKKSRIAFSHLWFKSAKTKVLYSDKQYYSFCASSADTYDCIKDYMLEVVASNGEVNLRKLLCKAKNLIDYYPDAEKIISNLFATVHTAQLTYDYFCTLTTEAKDLRITVPAMELGFERPKVRQLKRVIG